MAYWEQQDLEGLAGTATVLACLDDGNTGSVSQSALLLLQELSDSIVDGRLAPQFPNVSFPLTAAPPLVRRASLLQGLAMMYERRPEYVRVYGTKPQDRADKFLTDLLEKPDLLEQSIPDEITPEPATDIGGASVDGAERLYVDNADGTKNSGDF